MADGTIRMSLAAEDESFDLVVRQVAPHAAGGLQSERTAMPARRDGVNTVRNVAGTESFDVLRAAGAAADIDAAHGASLAENGGTAGGRLEIRDVSDANSGDIGEAFHTAW